MNIEREIKPRVLLELSGITVSHGDSPAIENINMAIEQGEIVTVIGPNGAGKSTLIKTALGILPPDSGSVTIEPDCSIGYVPQSVTLDPALPLSVSRFLKLSAVTDVDEIRRVLGQVGAVAIENASMHGISGGEMRRVLLARALLKTPDLLILDEPTAGVDIGGQGEIYRLIRSIRDRYRCGILLVSHDLHIVMAETDRVFCLNRHLCCSGAPEDVREHPEYLALFGDQSAQGIGIYRHHHDHDHDLHGDVHDHG